MKKIVPFIISGGLVASMLLGGCSSNPESQSNTTAQINSSPNQQSQVQNGRPNMSMNIGKIKSINDNTLTIYTADMSNRPTRNDGGEDIQKGQGDVPKKPEGEQGIANGVPPEEGMPIGGRQGSGMKQSFSEETTDITIDADTKIVTITFDNGTRQESPISLSDLKTDDVIQYTLKADTQIAESITLNNGRPEGVAPEATTNNTNGK
ncbi:hypothetical protein [Paenibacillus segetis]|uniref:Lipoprotein n=1 Tax=Paenibacillus segetis TaxID=1325360 RepID=A0ABQ1YIW7_9BACL|nr:hypothetical protein [Paenibacillus segetis]GGH26295.1 hypothetical protein GCM10008013_27040 [Paenibacillus segetis]